MTRVRSISRLAFLSLLLLASGGCELFEAGRPSIRLSLPATTFAAGADLPLSVENFSRRSWYGSSYCNIGVERLVDGDWEPAYGQICLLFAKAVESGSRARLSYALTEIPPGETVVMSWSLPLDAQPGAHRVRLRLSSGAAGDGDQYQFLSPQFTVVAGAGLRD